jgi:U32 family peptidase
MAKQKKQFIPELLAPAGSLSSALTAFDYGADAVYAGLDKFNARERTENFSFEEMSKLTAYAQKNNKKVYITLNTLIKESEIPTVVEYISEVAKLAPDAVIVQDLGVLRIIREYFPNLTVHASTQMGIHNSAGVNFAAKLGVKRVILERQTTLEEVAAITKNSKIETEVFVHGALCCSMSGNCILSSWMGGWSGNRGKCKQPCRRRYFSENGNGFFLSTKDLCSLDMIPQLKQVGVKSLKIEGRLRKPDYIKSVVSAYRLLLDAKPNDDIPKLIKQGREILGRSLGRKWTSGFWVKEGFRDIIEFKKLGVSGMPCGNITSTKKSGFNALITKRLHIGDRLRIQPKSGEEGPTFTVTRLYLDNKNVTKILKDQECFIPCDKEIPTDGLLYKIGESGGDAVSRIKTLPLSKQNVNLEFIVKKTEFSVKIKNTPEKKLWTKTIELSEAKNKALNSDDIIEMFKANNSDNYSLGNSIAKVQGNFFMPASVLKKIRREYWEWFEENVNHFDFNTSTFESLEKFRKDYQNLDNAKIKEVSDYSAQYSMLDKEQNSGSTKVHTLDEFNPSTNEIILPNYCVDHYLPVIKRKIRKAIGKGKKRFRVTSLYQFELLKDFKDIEISTSYPLPTCNSLAAKEIQNIAQIMKIKLRHVQAWVELEKEEVNNFISKASVPVEIYNYGRPHLFISRAFLPIKGKITDAKGNDFYVVVDSDAELVYIYSGKVLSIPEIPGTSIFKDLSMAKTNEEETSTLNYEYALL